MARPEYLGTQKMDGVPLVSLDDVSGARNTVLERRLKIPSHG